MHLFFYTSLKRPIEFVKCLKVLRHLLIQSTHTVMRGLGAQELRPYYYQLITYGLKNVIQSKPAELKLLARITKRKSCQATPAELASVSIEFLILVLLIGLGLWQNNEYTVKIILGQVLKLV